MEARFKVRKDQLLDECKIADEVFDRVMPRLTAFMEPFVESMSRGAQVEHANTYMAGLLSDLQRKNIESIAYSFGEERLGLQKFVGMSNWDDEPLRFKLARQIGEELGEPDGVIVFDPSGFAKSGKESVGVARQWLGRLGKIDNGQVAIYMGYVSRREHALADMRLYLPEVWAKDKKRREKAGVPKDLRFRTRHQLALEMLREKGALLPHAWVTGDDEMGRVYTFRRDLSKMGEQYLLCVPSNTRIRDLESEPPPYLGLGPRPKLPWQRVDTWMASLREADWTKVNVRDGAKGPLEVEMVARRVAARTNQRRQAPEETLVVIRYRDRDERNVVKVDYLLSNASYDTPLKEFARVAKAEHRIEECLQRAKSEAGLADYEVRNWKGWHHHQTLSLLASWFLVTESRRGKKMDARHYLPANPRRHRTDHSPSLKTWHQGTHPLGTRATITTKRTGEALSLETT